MWYAPLWVCRPWWGCRLCFPGVRLPHPLFLCNRNFRRGLSAPRTNCTLCNIFAFSLLLHRLSMLRFGRNFALAAAHKLNKLTPFHGFIKIIAYRPPKGGAGIAPLKLLKLLRKSMLEKASIHAGFWEWLRTVLPPFAHRSTPPCALFYPPFFVELCTICYLCSICLTRFFTLSGCVSYSL